MYKHFIRLCFFVLQARTLSWVQRDSWKFWAHTHMWARSNFSQCPWSPLSNGTFYDRPIHQPAPMNYVKLFKGWPPEMPLRNCYNCGTKHFRLTDVCQSEMKNPTGLSNKTSTARSVEDETRNHRRNANQNPEWWGDFSQQVGIEKLKFIGISRHKFKLRFWLNLNPSVSPSTTSNCDFSCEVKIAFIIARKEII